MRLRFLGFPHSTVYRTTEYDADGQALRDLEVGAGEEVEVSEALNRRLLADFAQAFEVAGDESGEPEEDLRGRLRAGEAKIAGLERELEAALEELRIARDRIALLEAVPKKAVPKKAAAPEGG